jgi:hypothetical protein
MPDVAVLLLPELTSRYPKLVNELAILPPKPWNMLSSVLFRLVRSLLPDKPLTSKMLSRP